MRLGSLAVCAAAIALLPAMRWPVAHAQARRPMSLVDIAELPRVLDPEISPDGRFVTYALSHADWKLNRPVWNLWRQEVSGGSPVPPDGQRRFHSGVHPLVA
jgi:hypothetical protein